MPGPDGALWFTEYQAPRIGRITTDGQVTEFPLPDRTGRPHAITPGGDGTLWFTEWGGNRVGSITTDGVIDIHDLPTPGAEPHGITLGPDRALWTALETGALARITAGPSSPQEKTFACGVQPHHHPRQEPRRVGPVLPRTVRTPRGAVVGPVHQRPARRGGVLLQFAELPGVDEIQMRHYAFLVDDDLFDRAYARLQTGGIEHWADPQMTRPSETNTEHGGRGVYFNDPAGHAIEMITKPYL